MHKAITCAFHQEGIWGGGSGDGIKHSSNVIFPEQNWENHMQPFKNNYRTQSNEHILKQEQTLFNDMWGRTIYTRKNNKSW